MRRRPTMNNAWTERIAELTKSRDDWKREWRLLNARLNMAEDKIKELEAELAEARREIERLMSLCSVQENLPIPALRRENEALREAIDSGIYLADFVAGERDMDKCEDCQVTECCSCCIIMAGRFLKKIPIDVVAALGGKENHEPT